MHPWSDFCREVFLSIPDRWLRFNVEESLVMSPRTLSPTKDGARRGGIQISHQGLEDAERYWAESSPQADGLERTLGTQFT